MVHYIEGINILFQFLQNELCTAKIRISYDTNQPNLRLVSYDILNSPVEGKEKS